MKGYTTITTQVADVLVDDHLKIGGVLFRVTQKKVSLTPGCMSILALPVTPSLKVPNKSIALCLPGDLDIKVYNQCDPMPKKCVGECLYCHG